MLYSKIYFEFDDLRIIRGRFYDTIEFEKLTDKEQFVYKIRNLIRLDISDIDMISFIIDKSKMIIDSLTNNDLSYIPDSELVTVIDIMKYLSKHKNVDKNNFINIYYNNCKHFFDLYFMDKFKDLFSKEYNEFMKKKKTIIDKKLKNFIRDDLRYYFENEQYQDLENLLIYLENELSYLVDKELQDMINKYGYISSEYYDKKDKIFEEEEERIDFEVEDDIKDIVSYSKNRLSLFKELSYDEEREELSKRLNDPELKIFENCDYLSISNLKFLNLVVDYWEKYHFLPEKPSIFCLSLIDFILRKNNLDVTHYISCITSLAINSFVGNEKVFKEKFIYENDKEITEEEVLNLINLGILIKSGEWLMFSSSLIQMNYVSYAVSLLDKNKNEFYSGLYFALSGMSELIFPFDADIYYFYEIIMDFDSEGFSKKYLNILFSKFISDIKIDNVKTIVLSTIDHFKFSIDFDSLSYNDLNNISYSTLGFELINISEKIIGDIFILSDFISRDAFKEFKRLFKKFFKEGHYKKYRINLQDLVKDNNFYYWLVKYNIDKEILKYYQIIKYLNEYTKNNFCNSYTEYQKLIENLDVVKL